MDYILDMNSTQDRERAIELAKTDPQAALQAARNIEDPWHRSQALAWVARFSTQEHSKAVIAEAKAASRAVDDPYKLVASSAWWLRAMIEQGQVGDASRELHLLLECSNSIKHPVSRLEALFLLFQAVFEVEPSRRLALRALLEACQAASSWKAGDRLREAAVMLALNHRDEADQVIKAMPEGKYKRQAIQRIAVNEHRAPRQFFW